MDYHQTDAAEQAAPRFRVKNRRGGDRTLGRLQLQCTSR
jgi:hypothetical protein